jgi:hypothetical protein
VAKRIPAAFLAALIAAFLLAACGESDEGASAGQTDAGNGSASESGNTASGPETATESSDSGSSPETAPSELIAKAEFLRKADGICEATTQKITSQTFPVIEEEQKKPGYNRKSVEAELIAEVMGPALQGEVEQLRALGAPAGDEARVNAMLAAIQEVGVAIERNAQELVKTGDSPMVKPTKLAESYGLESCPYG